MAQQCWNLEVDACRAGWWGIGGAYWPGTLLTPTEAKSGECVLYLFHTREAAIVPIKELGPVNFISWKNGCAIKKLHIQKPSKFLELPYWEEWADDFADVVELIQQAKEEAGKP